MGIYQLNRYLKYNCRKSIREIQLRELENKTIVIDTSIYLYKYAGEQRLIEGMYQLISTLLYYNITPIFIFDGVPPAEKKALLEQRHIQKRLAKHEYYTIIESLDADDENSIKQARYQLECLKKKFVRLSKKDYDDICELLECFGVKYLRAEREADELCAKLVMDGKAWACMSEDTDMFVYGCPRVLRYVSLMHCTGVLYNLDGILTELKMNQNDFREVCVLSGTDYNYKASRETSLQKTFGYYNKYMKWKTSQKSSALQSSDDSQSEFYHGDSQSEFYHGDSQSEFYHWLMKHTNYIADYKKLIETRNMFDITKLQYSIDMTVKSGNKQKLHEFLKKYNFIFMNHTKVK